jgi:protease-4
MNSIGITFDTVSTSPNASFMNPLLPLRPGDQRQLERMIDTIYVRFLERVAASRKRSVEDIRTVARGRVWTGEQAAARGLVDVVGGLTDAIELAKRRIGVAPNMRPKLKFYPEAEDLSVVLKRILAEAMGEDDDNDDQARVLYQVLGISPWQRAVAEILGRPVINQELRQRISLLATLRREPVLALMPHVIPFP